MESPQTQRETGSQICILHRARSHGAESIRQQIHNIISKIPTWLANHHTLCVMPSNSKRESGLNKFWWQKGLQGSTAPFRPLLDLNQTQRRTRNVKMSCAEAANCEEKYERIGLTSLLPSITEGTTSPHGGKYL